MSCYVLFNPHAGSGINIDGVKHLSELYNCEVVYKDITEISDYKEFFAGIASDDLVVLCGGDGTLNRFVNDTEGVDIPCELLYCALGSGNDFMRDIGKKPSDAPFSLKEYITDLPMAEVKGKTYRFINNVGFGIDGYCCQVGDELKKSSTKPVNYTAIAIKGLLFHYKPTSATVNVDGKEYHYKKVWIAPTMKGRFYGGGMIPTPEQDRHDPEKKLSVMIFYGKGKIKTLMVFPSIFKGEHVKHKDMVAIHTGSEITVTFDRPSPLQIDGETILDVTSYTAKAVVNAKVKC